jgi:hypothetical protein
MEPYYVIMFEYHVRPHFSNHGIGDTHYWRLFSRLTFFTTLAIAIA